MSNNVLNFDKKLVQRLFTMKDDSFSMYSKIIGEFGELVLWTTIDLLPLHTEDGARLWIHQNPQIGRAEDFPLEFRLSEMHYFLQIAPLFNPLNLTDYGLPSSSSLQEELP